MFNWESFIGFLSDCITWLIIILIGYVVLTTIETIGYYWRERKKKK